MQNPEARLPRQKIKSTREIAFRSPPTLVDPGIPSSHADLADDPETSGIHVRSDLGNRKDTLIGVGAERTNPAPEHAAEQIPSPYDRMGHEALYEIATQKLEELEGQMTTLSPQEQIGVQGMRNEYNSLFIENYNAISIDLRVMNQKREAVELLQEDIRELLDDRMKLQGGKVDGRYREQIEALEQQQEEAYVAMADLRAEEVETLQRIKSRRKSMRLLLEDLDTLSEQIQARKKNSQSLNARRAA